MKYKCCLFLFAIILIIDIGCFAQSIDRTDKVDGHDEILAPVRALVNAVNKADTSNIRSLFTLDPNLKAVINNGKSVVEHHDVSLNDFLKSIVNNSKDVSLSKKIKSYKVQSSLYFSNVILEIDIYLDGKLFLSGSQIVNLTKDNSGWKIIQLSETYSPKS